MILVWACLLKMLIGFLWCWIDGLFVMLVGFDLFRIVFLWWWECFLMISVGVCVCVFRMGLLVGFVWFRTSCFFMLAGFYLFRIGRLWSCICFSIMLVGFCLFRIWIWCAFYDVGYVCFVIWWDLIYLGCFVMLDLFYDFVRFFELGFWLGYYDFGWEFVFDCCLICSGSDVCDVVSFFLWCWWAFVYLGLDCCRMFMIWDMRCFWFWLDLIYLGCVWCCIGFFLWVWSECVYLGSGACRIFMMLDSRVCDFGRVWFIQDRLFMRLDRFLFYDVGT